MTWLKYYFAFCKIYCSFHQINIVSLDPWCVSKQRTEFSENNQLYVQGSYILLIQLYLYLSSLITCWHNFINWIGFSRNFFSFWKLLVQLFLFCKIEQISSWDWLFQAETARLNMIYDEIIFLNSPSFYSPS